MNKLIRDGYVAALLTSDYGGGWYSWHNHLPALFDPTLIKYIEAGKHQQAYDYVQHKQASLHWPQFFFNYVTIENLVVKWVLPDCEFTVWEYDGCEEIIYCKNMRWIKA